MKIKGPKQDRKRRTGTPMLGGGGGNDNFNNNLFLILHR